MCFDLSDEFWFTWYLLDLVSLTSIPKDTSLSSFLMHVALGIPEISDIEVALIVLLFETFFASNFPMIV